jgi:hypothetical protein
MQPKANVESTSNTIVSRVEKTHGHFQHGFDAVNRVTLGEKAACATPRRPTMTTRFTLL